MKKYKNIDFVIRVSEYWYLVSIKDSVVIPEEGVTKEFYEGLLFEDEIVNGGIDDYIESFSPMEVYVMVSDKSKVSKLDEDDQDKSDLLCDMYGELFYARYYNCEDDNGIKEVCMTMSSSLSKSLKMRFADIFIKHLSLSSRIIPTDLWYEDRQPHITFLKSDIDNCIGNVYFLFQSILSSSESLVKKISFSMMSRKFTDSLNENSTDE